MYKMSITDNVVLLGRNYVYYSQVCDDSAVCQQWQMLIFIILLHQLINSLPFYTDACTPSARLLRLVLAW